MIIKKNNQIQEKKDERRGEMGASTKSSRWEKGKKIPFWTDKEMNRSPSNFINKR